MTEKEKKSGAGMYILLLAGTILGIIISVSFGAHLFNNKLSEVPFSNGYDIKFTTKDKVDGTARIYTIHKNDCVELGFCREITTEILTPVISSSAQVTFLKFTADEIMQPDIRTSIEKTIRSETTDELYLDGINFDDLHDLDVRVKRESALSPETKKRLAEENKPLKLQMDFFGSGATQNPKESSDIETFERQRVVTDSDVRPKIYNIKEGYLYVQNNYPEFSDDEKYYLKQHLKYTYRQLAGHEMEQ